MNKRGFFFTLDSMIAISVIMIAVFAVSTISPTRVSPNVNYEHMHYLAEDTMTLSSITKLSDLDSDYVNYLIQNTNLTEEDLNKNIVECIILLWAYDEMDAAENLTRTFMDDFFRDEDYAFSITDTKGNQHLIYSTAGTLPQNLDNISAITSASRIVSGYKEDTLPRGYMARAYAQETEKNDTVIIPIESEGSAHGQNNRVIITKKFKLNAIEVYNATIYLAIHFSRENWGTSTIYVDGIDVTSRATAIETGGGWSYSDCDGWAQVDLWYGYFDVTDIINNNLDKEWHVVNITLVNELLGWGTYHVHTHPGSHINIEYKSNESINITQSIERYEYFDNIYSEGSTGTWWNPWRYAAGIWAMMPINIPKNADVKNVTLHLRVRNIHDEPGEDDIVIYFNNTIIYSDSSPSGNPYDVYLDITNYVVGNTNATNMLIVNIDSDESVDCFWSPNDVELYSDPENDPQHSSYVYINYTIPNIEKYRYGYITISRSEYFGGATENPKYRNFTFGGHELYDSYLHTAQLASGELEVKVTPEGSTSQTVFISPHMRAVPSAIYVDPQYYNTSINNTMRVEDVGCPACDLLPQTKLSYTLIVPSYVPYGDVFDTQEEAIDDAITRLDNLIADYADILQASIVTKPPISVSNIPSLYGPVIANLEVWR